jgi:hypothetical protein
MPVISGKAYWAKIDTPMGTMMNPDDKRYSVDVGNLDKSNIKLAKDLGMNIKVDDPDSGKSNAGMKESFVTLKKYGFDYNNELNPRPSLVDSSNHPLPVDMYRKIGNGSDIKVKFNSKTTKSGFLQFHLEAIQVINLVEYNPVDPDNSSDEEFEPVEGGFISPDSSPSKESEEDVPF